MIRGGLDKTQMKNVKIFTIKTESTVDFYDITGSVENFVSESGIKDGIILIYTPHTTAGVTINENADPAVRNDLREFFKRKVPNESYFKHQEGNSPAHILSSLFSVSETIIIQDAHLLLGTWQRILLGEFDGPRTRKVFLKIIAD